MFAEIASDMAVTYRGVFTSANASSPEKTCLVAAVEESLFDKELEANLTALKLEFKPLSAAETTRKIGRLSSLIDENVDVIKGIIDSVE